MGVESQFYILSDIGESALVLPLESSFYWASTNNGDDNQLFRDLVKKYDGNHVEAFLKAIEIAPYGARAMRNPLEEVEEIENTALEDAFITPEGRGCLLYTSDAADE